MNQSKSIFPDPKDQLSDGHWTWVSNQMGGSRSRSQCRIKWVECVQPKSLAGGKRRRWTNRDILILAEQLSNWPQISFLSTRLFSGCKWVGSTRERPETRQVPGRVRAASDPKNPSRPDPARPDL
ncbi:hypothetical protein Pst134EB_010905 [Puccinia striiformis f. sp. tritici]|nr:hypothetical protein Pst134EB_010905 [Puccinia striiformis f. sp. tritici]